MPCSGKGEPLHSIIPPAQGDWHNPHVQQYEYSVDTARTLLASRGFTWDASGQGFALICS